MKDASKIKQIGQMKNVKYKSNQVNQKKFEKYIYLDWVLYRKAHLAMFWLVGVVSGGSEGVV